MEKFPAGNGGKNDTQITILMMDCICSTYYTANGSSGVIIIRLSRNLREFALREQRVM